MSKLISPKKSYEGKTQATPDQAVLYYKGLALILLHAQTTLPQELVLYYTMKIQGILTKTKKNLFLSHPALVETYIQSKRVFDSLTTDVSPPIGQLQPFGISYEHSFYLEKRYFESDKAFLEDPEMRFIKEFLESHPQLFEDPLYKLNPESSFIKNSLQLFCEQFSLIPDKLEWVQNKNSQPSNGLPLAYILLRKNFYRFLFISHFENKPFLSMGPKILFEAGLGNEEKIIKSTFCDIKLSDTLFLSALHTPSDESLDQSLFNPTLPSDNQNALQLLQERTGSYSAPEIQEFRSILLYEELIIPQLVGYFTHHFHRLKSPIFQAFLTKVLLRITEKDTSLLGDTMKSPMYIKKQLLNFLENGLKKAKTLRWLDTYRALLFLYVQASMFLEAGELAKQTNENLKKFLELTLEEEWRFSQEEKGHFFQTIMGLGYSLKFLDGGSLFSYCAKAYDRQIVRKSVAQEPFWFTSAFERGENILANEESSSNFLPAWITQHSHYPFSRNFAIDKTLAPNQCQFQDEEGSLYQLLFVDRQLHLYRQRGSSWFKYIGSGSFLFDKAYITFLQSISCPLTSNSWTWVDERNQEAFIEDANTQELRCTIKNGEIVRPELFKDKLLTLYTQEKATHDLLERVFRLHSREQILVWKDKEDVCLIEIPRFGLEFQREEDPHTKEIRWMSSKHSGFYLDSRRSCPSLEPFPFYVLLRNKQGQQLAYVSSVEIYLRRQTQPVLIPHTDEIWDKFFLSAQLLTYTLSKTGEIESPSTPFETFFLAYLSLQYRDYARARKWVRNLKQMGPLDKFSEQLVTRLLLMIDKDKHPHALALKLKVAIAANTLTKFENFKDHYFSLLSQKNNLYGYALTKEEERTCVTSFIGKSKDLLPQERFLFENQAKMLGLSNKVNAMHVIKPIQTLRMKVAFSNENKEVFFRKPPQEKPIPITCFLRPGKAFAANFIHYYQSARLLPLADPSNQELLNLLSTMRFVPNFNLQWLRQLLMAVLHKPEDFPQIEELIENKTMLKSWLAKLDLSKMTFLEPFDEALPKKVPMSISQALPALNPISASSSTHVPAKISLIDRAITKSLIEKKLLLPIDPAELQSTLQADLKTLDEMEAFFKRTDEHPCVKREYLRLRKGIRAKKKELNVIQDSFRLNMDSLPALKGEIETLIKKDTAELQTLQNEILMRVQKYNDEHLLQMHGGILKPLTMHELRIFFAREDSKPLYRSNPGLTSKSVEIHNQMLGDSLMRATDLHSLERALEKLIALEKEVAKSGPQSWEAKSLSELVLSELLAKRVYDSPKYAGFRSQLLAFEFFGNIRLRENQCDYLLKLVKKPSNIDLEAPTGFGKSKVLIPLWLFLMSQKMGTALMVVPESLLIAQKRFLENLLGRDFDKQITTLEFDRKKANEIVYVQGLRTLLQKAKRKKKVLLIKIDAFHAMINLKLKEILHKKDWSKENEALLNALFTLRKEFGEIPIFFDESKECFDVRHHYEYALDRQVHNPSRTQEIVQLYRLLFVKTDKIRKVWSFEFFPPDQQKGKRISKEETYETDLLPKLAKQVVNHFKIEDENLKKAIIQDLMGHYTEACEEFLKTLDPKKLSLYQTFKEELTPLFQALLTS